MSDTVVLLTPTQASVAYELQSRLRDLDSRSALTLYAQAVVTTDGTGRATVADGDEPALGIGTVTGGLIGALVGALGGPIGLALGATSGATAGAVGDVMAQDSAYRVLPEVARRLGPDRAGLVAVLEEPTQDVVDALARELGADVARWPAEDVLAEVDAARTAELASEADARHAAVRSRAEQTRERIRSDWERARAAMTEHRAGRAV